MAAKIFPFGTALTILWHFAKPDGSNFNVEGYTYRLYYRTGNKETEVESPMLSSSGNTITFTIPATAPVAPGEYALRLVLFQHGSLFCRFVYNNAFVLSRRMADASIAEEQTSEGSVVNLYTVAEYYMFSPVIPIVSNNGYWVVNGETVVDGRGNPVPSSHTLTYDEETGELVIDQGRRDGSGASIEQRITSLATALESQEERYTEAETARGNLYAAAEAERNSEYESAESGREAAYQAAEGNKASSEAGDGSRWGEFKEAEGERTRLATEDHQQAGLDHQQAEYDHGEYESDHRRSGEDHEVAESDHRRAVEDHATATNDTSRAQEDHDRAEEDNARAALDHAQAENDHIGAYNDRQAAASDRGLADSDRMRAESDHNTATEDHLRAEQYHTTAASDHTAAANDHTRAESDHTRAEADHTESAAATGAANEAAQTATEAADAADAAREGIEGELAGKTDKPSSATEGNLAKFDENRNPVDAGYSASRIHRDLGYNAEQKTITLTAGETGKYVKCSTRAAVANSSFNISAPFDVEACSELLIKTGYNPSDSSHASLDISVIAIYEEMERTRTIQKKNDSNQPLYYEVDEDGNPTTTETTTVTDYPVYTTETYTEHRYLPNNEDRWVAIPDSGYYVANIPQSCKCVVSYKPGVTDLTVVVVKHGALANLTSQIFGIYEHRTMAEAVVSLAVRLGALEKRIQQPGNLKVGTIDAVTITRYLYPDVLEQDGAPSATVRPTNIDDALPWDGIPVYPGQRLHDNTNKKVYEGFAPCTAISDWVLLN